MRGPLLLLIYVNDLKAMNTDVKIRLFADDTNNFISKMNTADLLRTAMITLEKITSWFSDNKLIINKEKTVFSIFS